MELSLSFQILILLLPHFIMALCSRNPSPTTMTAEDQLSLDYYAKTCQNFEAIVDRKIKHWVSRDYTLAASLIRLHFHDCAVRGCDGSILLNHWGSERRAKASETLRGFEVIDDIKAEVEKKCPKTVSCADILTAAARDATVKIGGPFWENKYGRKDGRTSLAKEVELVPAGHENVTYLIEFFQSRGLSLLDLVVLSGIISPSLLSVLRNAPSSVLLSNFFSSPLRLDHGTLGSHTIGRCTCDAIQQRLYNFNGTGRPDPSIDARYLNFLRRKCQWTTEIVELDATTPTTFDSMYYKNLEKKMGLLSTDQLLYSDSRTSPIVNALATQPLLFYQQFAVSMVNLANSQVLIGNEGEIRTNCNFVNP